MFVNARLADILAGGDGKLPEPEPEEQKEDESETNSIKDSEVKDE